MFVFVNDTSTTEIYTYLHTLSLHDSLPISLLHFSVGQPMSPAAARINSSVSSSQTKALKGSRSPADLKGAFTGHLRLLPCSVRPPRSGALYDRSGSGASR